MAATSRIWLTRLGSEPIFHFLFLGALLFAAHRVVVGDPRTIAIDAGVAADLARRFRDQTGRQPNPAETDALLAEWKREEVLYREAMRIGLEREDPAVRSLLADRMRARAVLTAQRQEPSEADLQDFLAKHRSVYESPLRYDYELVTFPKSDPTAGARLESYERAVRGGAEPRTLGQPILGGTLNAEELRERVGAEVAQRVIALPIGEWTRIETEDNWLFARLVRTEGGLPEAEELHRRLVADWTYAERQKTLEQAVQRLVETYRFEEAR